VLVLVEPSSGIICYVLCSMWYEWGDQSAAGYDLNTLILMHSLRQHWADSREGRLSRQLGHGAEVEACLSFSSPPKPESAYQGEPDCERLAHAVLAFVSVARATSGLSPKGWKLGTATEMRGAQPRWRRLAHGQRLGQPSPVACSRGTARSSGRVAAASRPRRRRPSGSASSDPW